jgi:NDP-sugar pyrophosphorylase family protein
MPRRSYREGAHAAAHDQEAWVSATRAVILAGGRGTRLDPYTSVLPKPLMPVGEKSILEVVLGQLASAGITDVTLCVGYLSHLIRAVLDGYRTDSLKIDYVQEDQPLGTAAPLKGVKGLDKTFLVLNGDILTTLDFRDVLAHHRASDALLTIATHEQRLKIEYGILHIDGRGQVTGFEEKPELRAAVSMGIYVMEPEVFDYIPDSGHSDFPDLVRTLLAAGRTVSSYLYDGIWFDIGNHHDYREAISVWSARENGAGATPARGTQTRDER